MIAMAMPVCLLKGRACLRARATYQPQMVIWYLNRELHQQPPTMRTTLENMQESYSC